MIIKAHKSVWS